MTTDNITIKTSLPRETWAWVSAEAVRQGCQKNEVVAAALAMYRESREGDLP